MKMAITDPLVLSVRQAFQSISIKLKALDSAKSRTNLVVQARFESMTRELAKKDELLADKDRQMVRAAQEIQRLNRVVQSFQLPRPVARGTPYNVRQVPRPPAGVFLPF